VEPQKQELEIMLILGIQLMMNQNYTKENQINQDQLPVEHQFNQVTLSFSCQEDTEEEELLF
jgi:hypothetical protein